MTTRAAFVLSLLFAVIAAVARWWWFSRGSADVDAVLANVKPGDPIESVPLVNLGIADCWRKRPDTGEMVCHYEGAQRTYAIRFRAGNVTEVAYDRRLGGPTLPPFSHRVDLVLAPER